MKITSLLILMLLSGSLAAKSTVAIIDSGLDYEHTDIAPLMWMNTGETPNNRRDEDRNGYQDDIYGWNFAEDNNQIIDYSYLGLLNDDIRKFFTIQAKMLQGDASQEEIEWMKQMRADQEFIKSLSTYANFMHGTHVAGIAMKETIDSVVMGIKLIPTEVKLPFWAIPSSELIEKGLGIGLIKKGLVFIARQQGQLFGDISAYVHGHKVNVANGSFGTGYGQAAMLTRTLVKTLLRREATEEEVQEVAKAFLNASLEQARSLVDHAPQTLFVFASGNDGVNNDEFPTSPASVVAKNVISVGASRGFGALAGFSNYGARSVDVAAPGVAIRSAAPGNEHLRVSGTSQAAPFVANVASKIADTNSKLSPAEIKTILLKTVDYRAALKDKVRTGGTVNSKRAVQAAILSRDLDLNLAIERSRLLVEDIQEEMLWADAQAEMVLPLPGLFRF